MPRKQAVAPKPKMGRPLAEVDEKLIYTLAQKMCSKTEIASLCGISVDTLDNRFSDIVQKGYDNRRQRLRDLQWEIAEKGCYSMAIFLGKQYLGQSDRLNEPEQSGQIIVNIHKVPK